MTYNELTTAQKQRYHALWDETGGSISPDAIAILMPEPVSYPEYICSSGFGETGMNGQFVVSGSYLEKPTYINIFTSEYPYEYIIKWDNNRWNMLNVYYEDDIRYEECTYYSNYILGSAWYTCDEEEPVLQEGVTNDSRCILPLEIFSTYLPLPISATTDYYGNTGGDTTVTLYYLYNTSVTVNLLNVIDEYTRIDGKINDSLVAQTFSPDTTINMTLTGNGVVTVVIHT